MLAFGIVAPVFAPLVVRLEGGDTAAAAGMLGLFAAAWALMQFVFSPVQGALSDRFGRRPVILLSNLGLGGVDDDADPLETLEVEDVANIPASPAERLEQSQVMAAIEAAVRGLVAGSEVTVSSANGGDAAPGQLRHPAVSTT